ncbi:hypothetical protein [Thermoactinomyces sp. CICC 10521]|uniref:hypothetical protein n=1 Tax=Thermoactinomyces sp. CICC 10521 TaxID=2767426 RepID=UPI0018DC8EB1|nr:hypothetical protein [Thermoactinomyces sp. CICC 10521]MBH8609391.1 hypothetical protein [Thermoactinomyces sp. CICC 10521]
MKLFYIPITDKKSIENYNNTIVRRVTKNGEDIKHILPREFGANTFGLWGFKEGKSNDLHYNNIQSGDVLLNEPQKSRHFKPHLR